MTLPIPNPPAIRYRSFWMRLIQTRRRFAKLRNGTDSPPVSGAPKVSVMIITYNHERFIARALDSVLSQVGDFDIEVNVMDDASKDGTQDIVRSYALLHPGKINCYFNESNIGHIHTQLNTIRGFKTLRGEYFCLLEGDDYWTSKTKLAEQISFLDNNPRYVACAHWARREFEDGRPPNHFLPFLAYRSQSAGVEDLIRMSAVYHVSTVLYRNKFGTNPPLALADPYGCEVTINMIYGSFGDFYCIEKYMSSYQVHDGGSFSQKKPIDHWRFHIHGYRRFSLYLGMRYWAMMSRAVLGFTGYVLRAPKNTREVEYLSISDRMLFGSHHLVALFVLTTGQLAKRLWRAAHKAAGVVLVL